MLEEFGIIGLILISILQYFPSKHWIFRTLDFAKIQLTFIQISVLLIIAVRFPFLSQTSSILSAFILILCLHNLYILFPFTKFYPLESKQIKTSETPVRFLFVNVYQFNKKKNLLVDLIKAIEPDILLTFETDKAWDKSLNEIDYLFRASKKVPQDNTYGLHFYTTLESEYISANYLVSDDIPSIEAKLKTRNGEDFIFFGIHPPPPGPVQEETTIERDAEILAVSEKIKSSSLPCILTGDFNNVAWSRSAKLMKKNAQLLDPRIGRGFISTFHAKYLFFRFPIDLVFHTRSIYFSKLKTEKAINSDHLPVYGEFIVDTSLEKQNSFAGNTELTEKDEISEMIVEGKNADSDKRN